MPCLPHPFALSLSKGRCAVRGFDKLSPNGGEGSKRR